MLQVRRATHPQCYICLSTLLTVSSIWFLLLLGTGIYNVTFYPGIFRAIDPSRAILRESSKVISLRKLTHGRSFRAHREL